MDDGHLPNESCAHFYQHNVEILEFALFHHRVHANVLVAFLYI